MLFKARFGQAIFLSVFAGLIYLRTHNDQTGILDRISAIFFIAVSTAFGGINGPTYIFPGERAVFFREKSSGMYGATIYFISKTVSEIPINVFIPVLSSCIAFWLVGWNSEFLSFLYYTIIITLTTYVAYSLGLAMSCAILDVGVVIRLQPLVLIPFMLFSGFFLNSASIPKYFIWLEYISFVNYAFRACGIACFQNSHFRCTAQQFVNTTTSYQETIFANITTLNQTVLTAVNETFHIVNSSCPITTGDQVLRKYQFNNTSILEDSMILLGMTIGFQLIAYIFLRVRKAG